MTVEILINGKFSHAVRFLYLLTLKGGGQGRPGGRESESDFVQHGAAMMLQLMTLRS